MMTGEQLKATPRVPLRATLFTLLAIAFALRVHGLDLVHYNIDEAFASILPNQILMGEVFPLIGIRTSFGFTNPPLFIYMLVPFFAVSPNPMVAQLFFVVLGAAAVYAAWRAGFLLNGTTCGLAAAGIVAICPNAVEHSRRLWGHDLMVFCSALALWGAIAGLRKNNWKALAGSFAAAAVAQSFHLSGAILWLPGLVVLARRRPEHWKRAARVGTGVLFLVYLPWFIHEAMTGFNETKLILGILKSGAGSADLGIPVPPIAAWTLILGDFWHSDILGNPRPWMLSPLAATAETLLTVGAIALLATGLVTLYFKAMREHRTEALLIGVPLVLSPLIFGILLKASVPAYHLPVLIPAALAAAWGLSSLTGAPRKFGFGIAAFWAIGAVAITSTVRIAIARGEGTSPPLREKRAVLRELGKETKGETFYLLQDGRPPESGLDVSWAYLIYDAGLFEKGDATPEAAQHLFVIRHHTAHLRPQMDSLLDQMPGIEFDHVTLLAIPREIQEPYLEQVRKFPPPKH